MTIKISELPNIESASLISANASAIPLIVGPDTGNVVTYQTTVANVKAYVESGNLNVTGAVNANLTSFFTNVTITGNLNVQGTTTTTSSENLSTNSSVIDLHTFSSNLDPWTSDDGRDIGLRFFWYKSGSGAGTSALVWENDNSYLTWYGSGVGNANTGTITGTLGTIQTGQVLIANSTPTTANATGALQVSGGTSIGADLWVGGNIDGKGYIKTTGAVTAASLTINGAATVGSTLTTGGGTTAQSLNVNTVATIGSTLVVGSTATVNALASNGAVTGTTATFTSTGSISSTLSVGGTATVNSLFSNGTVRGTTITGTNTATVNALVVNTTIGVSGTVTTRDVVPVAGATYDLGSTGARYLNIFGTSIIGTTLSLSGTATVNALVVNTTIGISGTVTTRDVVPASTTTYNLGSSGAQYNYVYAQTFSGTSTTAKYADLAEKYLADLDYLPGTVVVFGGTKEITITETEQDVRVAGVISTAPAYLMNSESAGLPVALRGKVPVNVVGPVVKGSLLVTSAKAGYARAVLPIDLKHDCAVVAKSLVEDPNTEPRAIMAVIV